MLKLDKLMTIAPSFYTYYVEIGIVEKETNG